MSDILDAYLASQQEPAQPDSFATSGLALQPQTLTGSPQAAGLQLQGPESVDLDAYLAANKDADTQAARAKAGSLIKSFQAGDWNPTEDEQKALYQTLYGAGAPPVSESFKKAGEGIYQATKNPLELAKNVVKLGYGAAKAVLGFNKELSDQPDEAGKAAVYGGYKGLSSAVPLGADILSATTSGLGAAIPSLVESGAIKSRAEGAQEAGKVAHDIALSQKAVGKALSYEPGTAPSTEAVTEFTGQAVPFAMGAGEIGAAGKLIPKVSEKLVEDVIPGVAGGFLRVGAKTAPAIAAGVTTAAGHPWLAIEGLLAKYLPKTVTNSGTGSLLRGIGRLKTAILNTPLDKVDELGKLLTEVPEGVTLARNAQVGVESEISRLQQEGSLLREQYADKINTKLLDARTPEGGYSVSTSNLNKQEQAIRALEDAQSVQRAKWNRLENWNQFTILTKDAAKLGLTAAGTAGAGGTLLGGLAAVQAQPEDVEEATKQGFTAGVALTAPGLLPSAIHTMAISKDARIMQEGNMLATKGRNYTSSMPDHESQMQNVPEDVQRKIDIINGSIGAGGGRVVVATPEAIKAHLKLGDDATAPSGVYDDKTNTALLNVEAVKKGIGPENHEMAHAIDEVTGGTLTKAYSTIAKGLTSPDAPMLKNLQQFLGNYIQGKRLTNPDAANLTERQLMEEGAAELTRHILATTPIEQIFGGKTVGDMIGDALNSYKSDEGTVPGFQAPYTSKQVRAVKDALFNYAKQVRTGQIKPVEAAPSKIRTDVVEQVGMALKKLKVEADTAEIEAAAKGATNPNDPSEVLNRYFKQKAAMPAQEAAPAEPKSVAAVEPPPPFEGQLSPREQDIFNQPRQVPEKLTPMQVTQAALRKKFAEAGPPAPERDVRPDLPEITAPAINKEGWEKPQYGFNHEDAIAGAKEKGLDVKGHEKGYVDLNDKFYTPEQALAHMKKIGQIPHDVTKLTPDIFQGNKQFMPSTHPEAVDAREPAAIQTPDGRYWTGRTHADAWTNMTAAVPAEQLGKWIKEHGDNYIKGNLYKLNNGEVVDENVAHANALKTGQMTPMDIERMQAQQRRAGVRVRPMEARSIREADLRHMPAAPEPWTAEDWKNNDKPGSLIISSSGQIFDTGLNDHAPVHAALMGKYPDKRFVRAVVRRGTNELLLEPYANELPAGLLKQANDTAIEMGLDGARIDPDWQRTGAGPSNISRMRSLGFMPATEARGNSRPVNQAQFDVLASIGKNKLAALRGSASPTLGLDKNWDKIKSSAYEEAQKPWGGVTIDTHTGEPVRPQAEAGPYALSAREPDQNTISIPENATREQFDAAMEQARKEFPQLANQDHHLGVFHDDAKKTIDIDPILVVKTTHEVETIGAHTGAVGGAYDFATGNGYFPPHVDESVPIGGRTGASGMWDSTFVSGKGQDVRMALAEQIGANPDKHFYEQKPAIRQAIIDHFKGTGEAQYMPSTHPEAITHPAVRTEDDKIWTGINHAAAYENAESAGYSPEDLDFADQGFKTKDGRFLNRFEASIHAAKIGQLPAKYAGLESDTSYFKRNPEAAFMPATKELPDRFYAKEQLGHHPAIIDRLTGKVVARWEGPDVGEYSSELGYDSPKAMADSMNADMPPLPPGWTGSHPDAHIPEIVRKRPDGSWGIDGPNNTIQGKFDTPEEANAALEEAHRQIYNPESPARLQLMPAIDLAKSISEEAHADQKRKFTGEPYAVHPAAVADLVNDRLKPAAYLHDVLEDTHVTAQDLLDRGVDPETVKTVQDLTRRQDETYAQMIDRIAKNPDARDIKVPDIMMNLKTLPEGSTLHDRYVKALNQLIPSDEEMRSVLKSDQAAMVGEHRSLPSGTPISIRIDIPAYLSHGKYAVTVHRKNVGARIGYGGMVTVDHPTFYSQEKGALRVSTGQSNKFPMAAVNGEFNPSNTLPSDIGDYSMVGFNPMKHSYFYEKGTNRPIVGGDKAISAGNTVFVKNPEYGREQDFLFMPATQKEVKTSVSDAAGKFPEALPLEFQKDDQGKYRFRYNPKTKKMEAVPKIRTYNLADQPVAVEAAKGIKDKEEALHAKTDAAASKLAELFNQVKDNPEITKARGWYREVRDLLMNKLGGNEQDLILFTRLLAATSPNTNPGVNFGFTLDAWNRFKKGEYDDVIARYNDALDKFSKGELYHTKGKQAGEHVMGLDGFNGYLYGHDIIPYGSQFHVKGPQAGSPKKLGMHSLRVLDTLSDHWNRVNGLKINQFAANLAQTDLQATIDLWAARSLHRLLNEGNPDPWRILPMNEAGIKAADFKFGQDAFRKAAGQLQMTPDDLQAILWFAEKHFYDDQGWSSYIDKGDFRPLLRRMEPAGQGTFKLGDVAPPQ